MALKRAELREECYDLLGVTEQATLAAPQIRHELRMIYRQLKRSASPGHSFPLTPDFYLKASDSPDARRFLSIYYSMPQYARKLLPIEAFCVAADVSPLRILELIVAAAFRMGATASRLISAVNQPRLVEKSVEMGLTDDGIKDREFIAKVTGLLPSGTGAKTVVQVTQTQQQAQAADAAAIAIPVIAPSPEATIRRLVDAFNAKRGIAPAVTPAALPVAPLAEPLPSDLREREAITVAAEYVDADDEEDD